MRSYFEPSDDEREEGLKQPTPAHRAIAELVAAGFIRVLITTNFDRLLERALDDVGVAPTIIASANGIGGATPLPHARCIVLKVHGDYHDSRTRNSAEELAIYEPELTKYLSRIAEDFGLIVAGWSADYDVALRAALLGAGRRYPVYWCAIGEPRLEALSFINQTGATKLAIASADQFFTGLRDKVLALDSMAHRRPVSAAVTLATAKRFMAKPEHRIALHDLVVSETRSMQQGIVAAGILDLNGPGTTEELRRRVDAIERCLETLIGITAAASFNGRGDPAFVIIFSAATSFNSSLNGVVAWINLQLLPALLLYYAAGVAAEAADDYTLFGKLSKLNLGPANEKSMFALDPSGVLSDGDAAYLLDRKNPRAATSEFVLRTLRPHLDSYVAGEDDFMLVFDRFEYIAGLLSVDAYLHEPAEKRLPFFLMHYGLYHLRRRGGTFFEKLDFFEKIQAEAILKGEDWAPLKAGLFAGSLTRVKEAIGYSIKNMPSR